MEQQETAATPQAAAPQAPVSKPGEFRRPGPGGGPRRGGRFGRDFRPRKVCKFCAEKDAKIDYKDIPLLRGFSSERGKMWAARITGLCAWHQRKMKTALKRARIMALLPFASSV
jgi:small subunit ribosomal protein S18